MSSRSSSSPPDLVAVGAIATAHGIRGELSVHALTDFPERLAAGSVVLLETPSGELSERRILAARLHGDRHLLTLEGVPDRTAAERLRGGRLCVRESDLPALPAGQAWRHELPGMGVVTELGEPVGTVRELLDTGGDRLILVVDCPGGEALVPYVEPFVQAVDRVSRRITVRPIEGLLP